MLSECSTEEDEVIFVGTPFYNNGTSGVEFNDGDISDPESISRLRTLILKEQAIEKPSNLYKEADLYFMLNRPKEGIAEIVRYVWLIDEGTAILYEDGSESYSTLTKEQTDELISILER